MTDIVERLRNPSPPNIQFVMYEWMKEAADEIERLREDKLDALAAVESENAFYQMEIERLREEIDELKDLLQCTVNYTGASVSSSRFAFHAALKEGE